MSTENASAADETFDVVIVGSGGAGMLTALAAVIEHGMSAVVIEKSEYFGGSTALSGGAVWAPGNEILAEAGAPDTRERVLAYLEATVGDDVAPERRGAFAENAPRAISVLRRGTPLELVHCDGYSDYYPEKPGGSPRGRTIESAPFDLSQLGEDRPKLRSGAAEAPFPMPIGGRDYRWLAIVGNSPKGVARSARLMGKGIGGKLLKHEWTAGGQALAAGLRIGLRDAGIPLWLETPLTDLVVEDDRVAGVRVTRNGVDKVVRARHGVVLAAGGFEHNQEMREKYQPAGVEANWSLASESNTGDIVDIVMGLGADLALMDQAWWFPSVPGPDGQLVLLAERSLPGSIMVNGAGERYMNEATPYMEAGQIIFSKHTEENPHIPSWMIVDQTFRNRYLMAMLFPRQPLPQAWIDAGCAATADTLEELAGKIGVSPEGLVNTVERFNLMAAHGHDDDFGRGESAHDRYYSDPKVQPNPCLAPIAKAPFTALKVVPGDLGTCGGLRADENARVLKEDGTAIDGLYAIGNVAANAMGKTYPGAGATIAQGMVFGYIAAAHAAAHKSAARI